MVIFHGYVSHNQMVVEAYWIDGNPEFLASPDTWHETAQCVNPRFRAENLGGPPAKAKTTQMGHGIPWDWVTAGCSWAFFLPQKKVPPLFRIWISIWMMCK